MKIIMDQEMKRGIYLEDLFCKTLLLYFKLQNIRFYSMALNFFGHNSIPPSYSNLMKVSSFYEIPQLFLPAIDKVTYNVNVSFYHQTILNGNS